MSASADPKRQSLLSKDAAHSDEPRWTPQGTPAPPGAAAVAVERKKKDLNPFADDAENKADEAPAAASNEASGCKPCPYLNAEVLLLLPSHFQFTPLLCHARVRRVAEHRLYYPVSFLIIVVYLFLLFQTWLQGWAMFGILLTYALGLIAPIVACECTRMDRLVLGRLVRNFEWWWLFLNFLAVQCLEVMIMRAQPTTSPDEIARMVLVVCLLFVCCLYSFALDALVAGRPVFKGVWITIFLAQTGYTWYRTYFGGDTDKVDVTLGRFSALNLQAGCLLTVAAWEAKLVVSLLRHPRGLMMLGAQYVLVEEKDESSKASSSKSAPPCQRV